MTNFNFGIVKASFTNYLNESEDILAKNMFGEFMKLIKESDVLQAEFNIYKNLEEQYIPNENLAILYINENLNSFIAGLTEKKYNAENAKLEKLVSGLRPKISENKKQLYNNIHMLIKEKLSLKANANNKHKSFSYLLEHIMTNKPKALVMESTSEYNEIPKDFLIKKAVEKFNEKYSDLNESDKAVLKAISSDNIEEKEQLLESMKAEAIEKVLNVQHKTVEDEKEIKDVVKRINEMKYSPETYTSNLIMLIDFKETLD